MTREEAGFLGDSCSLGRAAVGRTWYLRGMQPLSEPQASRTEAEMPQPPSPPALQAPANSPQLAEANEERRNRFQAELGPASLRRAEPGGGRAEQQGRRGQRSEPFLLVLDGQTPLDPWHLELCFCRLKPGVLTTRSTSMSLYWATL